jgi:hypothetical protein
MNQIDPDNNKCNKDWKKKEKKTTKVIVYITYFIAFLFIYGASKYLYQTLILKECLDGGYIGNGISSGPLCGLSSYALIIAYYILSYIIISIGKSLMKKSNQNENKIE